MESVGKGNGIQGALIVGGENSVLVRVRARVCVRGTRFKPFKVERSLPIPSLVQSDLEAWMHIQSIYLALSLHLIH